MQRDFLLMRLQGTAGDRLQNTGAPIFNRLYPLRIHPQASMAPELNSCAMAAVFGISHCGKAIKQF